MGEVSPVGPAVMGACGAFLLGVGMFFPGVKVPGGEFTMVRLLQPFAVLGWALAPASVVALIAVIGRFHSVSISVGVVGLVCALVCALRALVFIDPAGTTVAAGGVVVPAVGSGVGVVSAGASLLVVASLWGKARVARRTRRGRVLDKGEAQSLPSRDS